MFSAGVGPTLVLAHGYGLTARSWSLLWPCLVEAGFHVIAFEHRGHGGSTPGTDGVSMRRLTLDYAEVLCAMDVDDAVLLGHSLGGSLSISVLLDQRDVASRVSGLVLVASGAGRLAFKAPQYRLQAPLFRIGVVPWLARSPTYRWFIGASLLGKYPSPAAIRAFLDDYWAQDQVALLPLLGSMLEVDDYDRLGELHVPTVILTGGADQAVIPWHSLELSRRMPKAQLVQIPEAGHLLNFEAVDDLVDAVERLTHRHRVQVAS